MPTLHHTPVLVNEIISSFAPEGKDALLDGTLGLGGHSAAYLTAGGEETTAVGIEADEKALQQAQVNLDTFGTRVTYIHGNYYEAKDSIPGGGILSPTFSHILLDLGIGSHQLSDESKGFSFTSPGKLTMRYGAANILPPSDVSSLNALEKKIGRYPDVLEIIQSLNERELADVIRRYGEEKYAFKVAQAITANSPGITTAAQLADVITNALPTSYEHGRINPATRTFQALRLAVNRELEVLAASIPLLIDLLQPEGQIAIISFHSLEDRIVKNTFRQEAKGCICPPDAPTCICGKKPRVQLVTKKPILASDTEKATNPRARSAKLRIAQRLKD